MALSFYYTIDIWIIVVVQILLMLVCIQSGRLVARNRAQEYADNPGNTAIAASLYGLLGLLLAFTFGMSGDQFKQRKKVILEEANSIGTAILRIQLYADSVQSQFRQQFREYLEARIRYYEAQRDTVKINQALRDADQAATAIWAIAAEQSKIKDNLVASGQMIPALNQMFDIANSRFWGELTRTPGSILTMLFLLSLCTAFVAGYTSRGKGKFDWTMAAGFCVLTSIVIFFIIDLDKPRSGIITTDQTARAITDLRKILR